MKISQYFLYFVLFAFGAAGNLVAQTDENGWVRRIEDADIFVFSREGKEGASPEYKALTVMLGDIDSAYSLVSDFVKLSATDSHIKSTEILQTVSDKEYYVRQIFHMPFFLKDRDMVARVYTQRISSGYIVLVQSEPNYAPVRDGIERIQQYRCLISLRKLGSESFELLYSSSVQMTGGDLVGNYTDKFGVESAFERLQQIQKLVKYTNGSKQQRVLDASNK